MRRKWTALSVAVMLAGTVFAAGNTGDLNDLRGLVLQNAKLPLFNKQTLQMMIFCDRAERQGKFIVGSETVMDLIQPNADVDAIQDGWNLKLYPLTVKFPELVKFWSSRRYSDGLLASNKVNIEQESKMAAGREPVFFRSPLLDLDGVGFEADFEKRTIQVRSDVNIVLRLNEQDPRKYMRKGVKFPRKYDFVTATSDTMLIDMERGLITLLGNVVVVDSNATMNCDRMRIALDRKNDRDLQTANRTKTVAPQETLNGVSQILCDGNIVIVRNISEEEEKAGKQQALADHLVYDVKKGSMTLTGDQTNPRILRGREFLSGKRLIFHRDSEHATVEEGATILVAKAGKPGESLKISSDIIHFYSQKNFGEFRGNVRVEDSDMRLLCGRMEIFLRAVGKAGKSGKTEKKTAAESKPAESSSALAGLSQLSLTGGQRELDRIKCYDGVRITKKSGTAQLLPVPGGRTAASPKQPPRSSRCRRTDEPLQLCAAPAAAARTGKAAPSDPGTEITSDSSNFDYGGNLLIFNGNVKVRDAKLKLDCERMMIYLMDNPHAKNAPKKAEGAGALMEMDMNGSGKALKQIVCIGRVVAVDNKATLKSDKLTLDFKPVKPGAPVTPGMFQSNGTMLVKMTGEGNLSMVSQPAPERKKKAKPTAPARKVADIDDDSVITELPAGPASEKKAKDSSPSMTDSLPGFLGKSKGTRTLSANRGIIDVLNNQSQFFGKVDVRDEQSSLECDEMYLYAVNVGAEMLKKAEKKAAGKNAVPDPDADPYDLPSVSIIPDTIDLMPGVRLSRVLCKHHVVVSRRADDGKLQQAFGDQADYVVASKKIILTGTPEEKPYMKSAEGRMVGERIQVDLEKERMDVLGGTQLRLH